MLNKSKSPRPGPKGVALKKPKMERPGPSGVVSKTKPSRPSSGVFTKMPVKPGKKLVNPSKANGPVSMPNSRVPRKNKKKGK